MDNRLLMMIKAIPYLIANLFNVLYWYLKRYVRGVDYLQLRSLRVGQMFEFVDSSVIYEVVTKRGFYVLVRDCFGVYRTAHFSRWVKTIDNI